MKLRDRFRIIEFGEFGDSRGNLVVAECGGVDVPFEVKRAIYIWIRFRCSKRVSFKSKNRVCIN